MISDPVSHNTTVFIVTFAGLHIVKMAEMISVVASVITVIQISEQVAAVCYKYFATAKDAENDILTVLNTVGGLKSVLEHLRILIDTNPNIQISSSLHEPLKGCQEALENLGS